MREVPKDFGIGFRTEDYRELLAREDLDGVVVSSSHPFHYGHALAALEQGVHVLCEKLMVLHAAEAHRLASLAASKKLHFLVACGWNDTPLAVEARDLILKGKVGKIEHVQ